MATYVLIQKNYEDDNIVVYEFGPDNENIEKVEFNKLTGEYRKIDTENALSNFYFLTAVSKIIKHNKNNPDYLYPNKLIYAS
jgi:hypothetical protein